MKTLQKILCLLLTFLAFVACERNYEAPPLNEPKYSGPEANTTIAQLKTAYAAATQDVPLTIEEDLILKAWVTANDESGNIFKQIFIADTTGGIVVGVDHNSVYTIYRVGQEVYIDLRGMCVSVYGGELQLGYPGAYNYRTPWEDFMNRVQRNSWPDEPLVKPVEVEDLSTLNLNVSKMTYQLVCLKQVTFTNGGKNTFAAEDAYGTETLKDIHGNIIEVRTSSYADFAKDRLPLGMGTLTGILGRYNGSWQLTVREREDIGTFSGNADIPDTPVEKETVFFSETFGTGDYTENKPKIADFTDFDMKTPVSYSDVSGLVDIRATKGVPSAHAWFKSSSDCYLMISGINTSGHQNIVLSYDLAANVYQDTDEINLNVMTVKCNGVSLEVPSIVVSKAGGDSNSTFKTIQIGGIPAGDNITIEFFASGTGNTLGLRLDNIKLTADGEVEDGDETIVPEPVGN